MKLTRLLQGISNCKIYNFKDYDVKKISQDSREIGEGSLFVAIKGLHVDGNTFIFDAIQKGAKVIVSENPKSSRKIPNEVVYIKVEDSRKFLGLLSAAFYGYPSRNLKIIGVTGTDGKTTVSTLISELLNSLGHKTGLISTIGAKIKEKEFDTGLHVTSPDPTLLHSLLYKMVKQRCEFAVLEVTSHALDQERVFGIDFDCAVLTNVTHEHLDYHKTFQKYLQAKIKLFKHTKKAVLNKDDPNIYTAFKKEIDPSVEIITYGLKDKGSDILAININESDSYTTFELIDGVRSFSVRTKLLGEYNVYNILAAIAAVKFYTPDIQKLKKYIAQFQTPKGRLEKIKKAKLDIFIDFAHTPNSLENVLGYLKRMIEKRNKGRLIAVLGCAGERDVGKRSLMGEISTRIADVSIFTAEDPRSENVNDIIREMVKGAKKNNSKEIKLGNKRNLTVLNKLGKNPNHVFIRIPERGEAISFAIQKLAKKEDVIIICGKGHEMSMAYNGKEYEWSDFDAVKVALRGGVKEIKR